MYTLNIFEKLYESSNFGTILMISMIVLVLLFLIILILGIRDSKKSKMKNFGKVNEVNDIKLEMPTEEDQIKEDVTFEVPTLTKNLEEFKKNLEDEIQNDNINEDVKVKKTKSLNDSTRPFKILDVNEIEDTVIIEKIDDKDDYAFADDSSSKLL